MDGYGWDYRPGEGKCDMWNGCARRGVSIGYKYMAGEMLRFGFGVSLVDACSERVGLKERTGGGYDVSLWGGREWVLVKRETGSVVYFCALPSCLFSLIFLRLENG